MTVFIAHAPQDKTAAESLAEKLRQRAFLVELETGEGAMRPLAPMDAVVGLISKDFVFSPYKLRLEKRLLDAWVDGQLIQVKLDHAFAPVGLRDLPAIDASFEAQREPFTWMKVADALRALRQESFAAPVDMYSDASPSSPDARHARDSSVGAGKSAPPHFETSKPRVSIDYDPADETTPQPPQEWTQNQTNSYGGASYDQPGAPVAYKRAASRRGGGIVGLGLLIALLIGVGATAYFTLFGGQAPKSTPPGPGDQPAYPTAPPDYVPPLEIAGLHFSQPILMAAAIVAGLVFMAIIAIGAARNAALDRKMGKPDKKALKRARTAETPKVEAPAAAPAPAPAPAAEVAEPLVFISYARADQPSVDPLAKAVKASGHPIWIDTDEINAGTSWAGEIVRAIKSAGHVLIMCSPRSFESDQVKREVYLADRYKKPLMPVFLEAAEPPEDFEYFFAGVQWLKLHEAPEADRPAILTRALPAA